MSSPLGHQPRSPTTGYCQNLEVSTFFGGGPTLVTALPMAQRLAILPSYPRTRTLGPETPHNWRSGGRARGACLAERIIEVREIPRWPESSSDGTAYVMHKSDLREEDFKAPWFATIQLGDNVSNFGKLRGFHSKKPVHSWAWVIRTDYATGKACSKVADGQLESCKPRIVEETITLVLISTSVIFPRRSPH
ncbi:hypothetical protein E4U40_004403 [Claviceps sp. LM458 group G5]|nr:hypothetical protein E4U40_004403 [Claviceps sp. LM458 group G5]